MPSVLGRSDLVGTPSLSILFGSTPLLRNNSSDSLDPGNIVYAYVLGDHVIVLNSFKATNDLLTKRGAKYSNRPDSTMTEDMFVLPLPPFCLLLTVA